MAECKRILAIHIYRSATGSCDRVRSVRFQHRPLPSTFCSTYTHVHRFSFSLSAISFLLFLSLELNCHFSYISRFLRLRFAPFSPTLRCYVQLALSSSSLSSVSSPKCGGAMVKGQKRGRGIESFVRRREPPSHGKIFALLSITSSGKLKFSVAVGQRSGDVLMTTIHVPRTIRLIFIKCNAIELQCRLMPCDVTM